MFICLLGLQIGEVLVVLVVKKELKNEHDQHAVAVIRDGAIIGHV